MPALRLNLLLVLLLHLLLSLAAGMYAEDAAIPLSWKEEASSSAHQPDGTRSYPQLQPEPEPESPWPASSDSHGSNPVINSGNLQRVPHPGDEFDLLAHEELGDSSSEGDPDDSLDLLRDAKMSRAEFGKVIRSLQDEDEHEQKATRGSSAAEHEAEGGHPHLGRQS